MNYTRQVFFSIYIYINKRKNLTFNLIHLQEVITPLFCFYLDLMQTILFCYIITIIKKCLAQSVGAAQHTDGISAKGQDPHPSKSVWDITLNKLMVKLQVMLGFGQCGVRLYCHRSHVQHLIGSYLWVKKNWTVYLW